MSRNKIDDIYLKTLIRDIPIGLYIRDTNGDILLANNVYAEVTGYSIEELEHKNIAEIYPDINLEDFFKHDEEIIKTKDTINFDINIALKDGIPHDYWVYKSPVLDNKNNVIGYVVLFKNIDKEKLLEESKRSFIATLTHDLKTPTNAQINMLNLIMDGKFGILNPKQEEIIGLTRCSCKYVSDLVTIILDTYRYDSGHISVKPQLFDINLLISLLCSGIETLLVEKNQKIEFANMNSPCMVYADRLQIKRVIVNLLSNAINYGFPNTTIKINLVSENDEIEVYVENQSKQIPDNELECIFNKYQRTKFASFNRAGSGLGLYLAKQIIDLHNGEIYAKSFENGSCIFGFKIPINENIKVLGKK